MKDKFLIQEIEKYIAFLKKLSEDDINALLEKKKEIVFEIKGKQGGSKGKEDLISDREINVIVTRLGSIENREDGFNYINSLKLTRIDLERILKLLDLPFAKKDSISKLNEKIFEGTIGFKLRSQAIQNKS